MEKNLKKFYTDLAESYDYMRTEKFKIDQFIDLRQRDIVLGFIENSKTDSILEIGSGTGRITIPLAKHFNSKKITCVDLSPGMIKQLNAKLKAYHLKNVSVYEGDLMNLPFEKEKFDCVLNIRVIWHIKEDAKMVKEISRVSNKNGILILDFVNKYGYWGILKFLMGKKMKFEAPVFFYSLRNIKNLLHKNGYKIVKLRGLYTFPLPYKLFGNRVPKLYKFIEKLVSGISFPFSKYIMVKAVKVK